MELGFKHCANSLHFFRGSYDLGIISLLYKWGNWDRRLCAVKGFTCNVKCAFKLWSQCPFYQNTDLACSDTEVLFVWLVWFGGFWGHWGVKLFPSSYLDSLKLSSQAKLFSSWPLTCLFFLLRAPSKHLIKCQTWAHPNPLLASKELP